MESKSLSQVWLCSSRKRVKGMARAVSSLWVGSQGWPLGEKGNRITATWAGCFLLGPVVSAPGPSSRPGLSILLASPALQSWVVLTLGIGGLHGLHPGYGRHLGRSGLVGEAGRTLHAQLWKSNGINFASSDLTTVLWSELCLNFKKRRLRGAPFRAWAPWARCASPSSQGPCSLEPA